MHASNMFRIEDRESVSERLKTNSCPTTPPNHPNETAAITQKKVDKIEKSRRVSSYGDLAYNVPRGSLDS